MKPVVLNYARAATVTAAIGELEQCSDRGRVIAGGQSLGPLLNLRLAQPSHLIDISRIDDLRAAGIDGDMLVVGACVTHARIEDGEIPDATRGLMRRVAAGIAYRAVRNRGTIGGSLAHADPAADWLTTMVALDAALRLHGPLGRREIKVSKFVVGALETSIGDGEIVTHVLVPRLSDRACWGHAKYAKKPGDFAESMAIAVSDPERGVFRVVLGRRADPPVLLSRLSDWIGENRGKVAAGGPDAAIDADFGALGIDRIDWTMHRAIVARALRGISE